MLEKVLDGLKGFAKLIAIIPYGLGYILYAPSKWILELKLSGDKKVDLAIAAIKEELAKPEAIKPIKKRAPRKKKVVETVANPATIS